MANISELKFDDKNLNKHTQYGMGLLEKSLRENGAGHSILIDKDNRIIAGNGIVEAAGSIGLDKVKIVEATGNELIAVKRTDISLDSKEGRQMALADNATAAADLEWDEDLLLEVSDEFGINTEDWGVNFDVGNLEDKLEEGDLDDETFLTSCYTKKNDVLDIEYEKAVSLDDDYSVLKEKADSCINPELKKILQRRLKDFADFNFDYIADFYLSGATEDEKKLLVEFGLVIPTEKEAFINKFLDLERSVILGSAEDKDEI